MYWFMVYDDERCSLWRANLSLRTLFRVWVSDIRIKWGLRKHGVVLIMEFRRHSTENDRTQPLNTAS
jgi:hypothetical protein